MDMDNPLNVVLNLVNLITLGFGWLWFGLVWFDMVWVM